MLTTPMTVSVGFAPLYEEMRLMRQALENIQQSLHIAPTDAIGGIELAMEITRLSKSRIYALVQQRGIPHSKRSKKLYFNRTELLAWIEAGKRQEK